MTDTPLPETTQPPAPAADTTELRYLDAKRLCFTRRGATLRVTLEDEACYGGVKVLRMFPLSEPDKYMSVRGSDGKEIGVLTDPAQLDRASRSLLAEELHRHYVIPVIQQIVAVKEGFGTVEWRVMTNRGACTFTTRGVRETTIVQPTPDRYILTDIEGNRFDVPDLPSMDELSQTYMMRYV